MIRAWFWVVLVLMVGCGGADFHMGSDWQPDEARFFDDGVDMIADMSKLSGKWAYAQEDELQGRVQLADLVAEVEILSIQTKVDIEGMESKRIKVRIVEKMYGVAPDETFAVASGSDSPGYVLIQRHEKRLTGRFIVFVRWFRTDNGAIGHHFHMSPSSEEVRSAVAGLVRDRKAELKTRVIKD